LTLLNHSMDERDRVRFLHMLDAARDAIAIASTRTRAQLDRDRVAVLAIVKCIEIIGEAASRVSPMERANHPEVPWSRTVAMRNRLIHVYFDIDLDVVWATVEHDLPVFISQLERVIEQDAST
jgi:uncharacterized protein with HEPN domain